MSTPLFSRRLLALMLAGLPLPAVAADGYSLDIELIHLSFSAGSLPGIDSPVLGRPGTFRFGTLVQFEKDPLILLVQGEEKGAVVSNRVALDLGVAYDISRRVSVRLIVPTAASFGGEIPELGGDAVGLGDMWLGGRIQIADPGPVTLGIRADLGIPTGGRNRYLGEGKVRFAGGVLASAGFGPVDILLDAGIHGRSALDTENDLIASTEFDGRLATRVHILPDLLAANVGVASRFSLNGENDGGAGTSLEALAGVQLSPAKTMLVDVGFGKGLSTGYGSTDFRVMAGFTYIIAPPEPVIEPVVERDPEQDRRVAVEEIPDVEILPEPVVEVPKVQWKEGELARVQEKEIIIRDPIQFEEGNANILQGSLPILKEVARLMNENGQIGFMIIEGHASAEGSFEYNYDLSNLRARSIWQALIEAGVHPVRIGYRGMGEVQPVVGGDDQAAREANRRVVFSIVRQYQPGDAIPELKGDVRLPWNGEARAIAAPKLPESFVKAAEAAANPPAPAPAPPPPPRVEANKDVPDANIFRQDDDEEQEPTPAPQNGGGQ